METSYLQLNETAELLKKINAAIPDDANVYSVINAFSLLLALIEKKNVKEDSIEEFEVEFINSVRLYFSSL